MSGESDRCILVLNSGSSSIKFALFPAHLDDFERPRRKMSGSITGIGTPGAELSLALADGEIARKTLNALPDHAAANGLLLKSLGEHHQLEQIEAVGHRLVHGGPSHFQPQLIDTNLLAELRRITIFAPEHLPQAIALIDDLREGLPLVPQIACFDTAFHQNLPIVARMLALPRKLQAIGVRRYGFHGLSYEYLMRQLLRIGRPGEADGRVILAHLGNGASLAAIHGGKPIDTTMGMTPAGGLVMSTRSGDIDPGLVSFLERHESLSPENFHRMVNHESGLLGISESTGDMWQLIEFQATDSRAAEAVDLFCYSARKWIGAFATALGGIDTLVFSGGIGEHQAEVRRRICKGLTFLGVELAPSRNDASAPIISRDEAAVTVRVIPTDEESTILRSVLKLLSQQSNSSVVNLE